MSCNRHDISVTNPLFPDRDVFGGSVGDAAVQAEQVARLQQVKATRDPQKVAELLGQIDQAARDPNASLMPLFVEGVAAYVTLGEICGVLRNVFGEYQPDVWV